MKQILPLPEIKYSVASSQVALYWLISFHGETVVAIPGVTKETHTMENAGAMTFSPYS